MYNAAGKEVLFFKGNSRQSGVLTALSLASGAEREVATVSFPGAMSISPDGRHIAYSHRTAAGPNAAGELLLMTIDGQPERRLLATARGRTTPTSWSPDARFLLYHDTDDTPRVMNIETGASWKLVEADDQPDWSYDGAWAPDGSYIVMTGDETRKVRIGLGLQGVTYETVVRLMNKGK